MIIVSLIFGLIAAIMAYIITFEEYKHHYTNKKQPRRYSLEMAVVAFVFLQPLE